MRFVPEHIEKPPYCHEEDIPDLFTSPKVEIKRPKAIESMRDSCRLAANILDKCEKLLKVIRKMILNIFPIFTFKWQHLTIYFFIIARSDYG